MRAKREVLTTVPYEMLIREDSNSEFEWVRTEEGKLKDFGVQLNRVIFYYKDFYYGFIYNPGFSYADDFVTILKEPTKVFPLWEYQEVCASFEYGVRDSEPDYE